MYLKICVAISALMIGSGVLDPKSIGADAGFISVTTALGYRYLLSDYEASSFTSASTACTDMGSTMVAYPDNARYQDMVDYLSANAPTYDSFEIWVPVTKTSRPTAYYFTGADEVASDNWYPGEPNRNCGRSCCYRMTKYINLSVDEHLLGDNYCSSNYYFVCEDNTLTTTTTPLTTSTTTTTTTTTTTPTTTSTTPTTTPTTPTTISTTPTTTTPTTPTTTPATTPTTTTPTTPTTTPATTPTTPPTTPTTPTTTTTTSTTTSTTPTTTTPTTPTTTPATTPTTATPTAPITTPATTPTTTATATTITLTTPTATATATTTILASPMTTPTTSPASPAPTTTTGTGGTTTFTTISVMTTTALTTPTPSSAVAAGTTVETVALSTGQQMTILYIGIIIGGSIGLSCCCSLMWLGINRTRRSYRAKHLNGDRPEKDEEKGDASSESSSDEEKYNLDV